MDDSLFYNMFESRMEQDLLKICRNHGMLENHLLQSDDINDKWNSYAPEYMAQSVKEIADYPTVAIAWAAYIGMAVACWWNRDWDKLKDQPYSVLQGERGFDDMDEHIVRDILGLQLEGAEAKKIENVIHSCAEHALGLIRREGIEPQSKKAFYVYARTEQVMFKIGAAIELHRLGYEYTRLDPKDC
jgi:hypothetical protein